ncbi:uncharacterized protein LOC116005774 [Ipomoea triloba]|uniref:uncharacterized protein LOC116005774 n=1 Tax=Ipomoea triloba TaxID=35885 RepID=UPI00125DE9FB|nr:uncharacterized protein LOC116005774 [Ipomoea triloba]
MAAHLAPEFSEEDCIMYPGVEANNFELKISLIQMVQANQFGGARVEDPKAHIVHFDRICQTVKMNDITSGAIKLRLFPFSLRDQALSWLNSFPANHFITWEQLYKAFMQKYCPPSKAAKLKKQIQNFQQFGNEDLPEAWKIFKELRRQCPKNLMTSGDFISSLYEGLANRSKVILATSSFGGIFIDIGPETGEQLIERITSNNTYWYTEGMIYPRRRGQLGCLKLKRRWQCRPICGGTHASEGQGQGYGNYQQQGRNQFVHSWNNQGNQVRNPPPGFQGQQGNRGGNQGTPWRNNQNQNQGQFQQKNQNFGNTQGQGFSRPPQDVDMQTLMNTMMAQMSQMSKLQATVESQQATIGSQQVLIESLKAQQQGGGNQFPNQTSSSNGRLPASTENPRHQVNAVTTRSGLSLKDPPFPSNDPMPEKTDKKDEGIQRLWRSKESDRESKFHKMLDKLEISMPFVEAVTQIPSYKKFLKNILGNKKKPEKSAVVDLSEGALTCAVL